MTSHSDSLQELYQRVAPSEFFAERCRHYGLPLRSRVYSAAVVLWMMIYQRLHAKGTQAAAVQGVLAGGARGLLVSCRRVREGKISPRTGGYCRARQKLPRELVRDVSDHIVQQLQAELRQDYAGLSAPVFVLDGSSLQLQAEPELRRAYPPGRNQHGPNHWPLMRLVVLHDVCTGLALEPLWAPMYGKHQKSEQQLAEQAMDRLPAGSVLLGDRYFGVFATAYSAQRRGHPVLLRLNTAVARRLSRRLQAGTVQELVWRPSSWDRQSHPELPAEAEVTGRLMVFRLRGSRSGLLYLFTTLDLAPPEVARLYARRWNIETDLRSLKRTVRLHHMTAKSVEMTEKELLAAFSAYNLVRAVMCLAARQAGLSPRQLSFSQVQDFVEGFMPALASAPSQQEADQIMDRLLSYASCCRLPNRKRRRSYPRAVWGSGYRYPSRSH